MYNILIIITLLLQDVVMADGLRSSGKIYVVVIICLLILFSLFVYLYRLENKINSLKNK
tara:strand:+ start:66 stop:242 length:177 start_codon:yes stop_codon:yes gene_type:complete